MDARGEEIGAFGRVLAAINSIPGGGVAKRVIEGSVAAGKGVGRLLRGSKNIDEVAEFAETVVVANRGLRRAPAPDNYRGRFNAERHAQGKSRLPDDYDAHHRIPQEYRDHPDFNDFDFDAPSNIQGVKGSRADVNTHQEITNRWAEFRRQNPNASGAQIEDFANHIDSDFAGDWFD